MVKVVVCGDGTNSNVELPRSKDVAVVGPERAFRIDSAVGGLEEWKFRNMSGMPLTIVNAGQPSNYFITETGADVTVPPGCAVWVAKRDVGAGPHWAVLGVLPPIAAVTEPE